MDFSLLTTSEDEDDDIPLIDLMKKLLVAENITDGDVVEWIQGDDVAQELNDEELAELVEQKERHPESESEGENETEIEKVSHSAALCAIETTLKYIEQHPEVIPADILFINK